MNREANAPTTDVFNSLLNDALADEGDGIKRDRWDRPVLVDPMTGEIRTWLRPSQLAKILDDNYNLHKWEMRHVVKGMGYEDLSLLAASVATTTEPEDKAQLDRIAEDAKQRASAPSKSNVGVGLHGITARRDKGETDITVPSKWANDIEAYDAGHKAYGLWPHGTFNETFVVVPELGCAGRFDRLLMGDGWSLPRMTDIKTGTLYALQCAIQLAVYAHASHYLVDAATSTFEVMPEVDKEIGIVTHLPAGQGRVEFFEIDIAAGLHMAQVALEVYEWRKRTDVAWPLMKWAPVPSEPGRLKDENPPVPARDDASAPSASSCTCGSEATPNMIHRLDAPCFVPDGTIEGAELFAGRFAWAKARVHYVAVENKQAQQLAEVWSQSCADIPTFRNGGPRNHNEIDRVAGACNVVEMAESLPFFDPDPAKSKDKSIKWITGNEDTTNEQRQFV